MYCCWKNQEKNGNFWKNGNFGEFFLIFFSNGKSNRVKVFCLAFSASWRFIWAIKHPQTMIYIFWLINVFFLTFSDPCTGRFWKKNAFFFGIFLTGMYRSSVLACSKHTFFHYQHPTSGTAGWLGRQLMAAIRTPGGNTGLLDNLEGVALLMFDTLQTPLIFS